MNEMKILELAEKAVLGTLTTEEQSYIVKQCASDPAFNTDYNENLSLLKGIQQLKSRTQLLEIMNEAHNELRFGNKSTKESSFRQYFVHNIYKYASVAVITLITVVSTLYFSGWYNQEHNLNTYRQLKSKLSDFQDRQKSVWEALFSSDPEEETYIGTSFAISQDGFLVTSYHVIKDYDSIFIVNHADSLFRYRAEVVYVDRNTDLAFLKVNDSTFNKFEAIPYSFSEIVPDLGEYVYTLGYSKTDVVFGEGSISSLSGYNDDTTAYQVSIPSNPGNSGGPLINSNGEIIGILCAKNMNNEAVTFAVRSGYLLNVVDSLRSDSTSATPVLPQNSNIRRLEKTKQIKKIKPFIYKVEVY